VQEYLDALAEQFETRTAMIEADWQQRLDVVANRVPDVSPEFLRLGEQMAELEQRSVNLDEQFASLTADSEARLAALAAESQTNMTALALRFQEQEATLDRTFAERLAAVEQLPGLAAAVAQLPALAAQVNDIESAVAALGETRAVLADQVTNLESVVTLGESFGPTAGAGTKSPAWNRLWSRWARRSPSRATPVNSCLCSTGWSRNWNCARPKRCDWPT
jgi:chromosome segregation ATPase